MTTEDALHGNQWRLWKEKVLTESQSLNRMSGIEIKFMMLSLDEKGRDSGLTKTIIRDGLNTMRSSSPLQGTDALLKTIDPAESWKGSRESDLNTLETLMLSAFDEALKESSINITKRDTAGPGQSK